VRRKTVTVLFCDVTGSTALGERLDPESFRLVMRGYFDTARRVIEHHGGTVEKFIGDAVMAVFGVPVLHEDGVSDDPRDRADAALNRAEISYLAGQYSRVDEKIDEAIKHYDRKGATAYVARARRLAAQWT
jgi:class 3 adenylate cyclase